MKKYLTITFATIVFYRVLTYILIFFEGNTAFWARVTTDNYNHYQIGILLLLLAVFVPKRLKIAHFKSEILAVGTGMIIDEIADVIKLFHIYPLPMHFRDSFADLILIALTYLVFTFAVILFQRISLNRAT